MRRMRTFCAGVLLLAGAATASADTLGLDPAGLPGFTGSVSFNADDVLLVDLEYAVFAPGTYKGDADPSRGSEYVYAYQAFNNSARQALTTVTIGLFECNGISEMIAEPGYGAPGGIAPTMFSLLESSAITRFLAPQVPSGACSTVFLFTSANPPTFAPASAGGGGYSDQLSAPSPTPEPTSALLLGLGGLLALSRRSAQR